MYLIHKFVHFLTMRRATPVPCLSTSPPRAFRSEDIDETTQSAAVPESEGFASLQRLTMLALPSAASREEIVCNSLPPKNSLSPGGMTPSRFHSSRMNWVGGKSGTDGTTVHGRGISSYILRESRFPRSSYGARRSRSR